MTDHQPNLLAYLDRELRVQFANRAYLNWFGKTREEVLEYAGAFLQLYREQGRYLDRTVHYVARVGLDYIKERIVVHSANRKALYARLRFALQGEPDPWRERAKGAAVREFEPLHV